MNATVTQLIAQRERAMALADRLVEEAWPARKGADYVRGMTRVAEELAVLAAELAQLGAPALEVSRTHSNLGSVLSDLAPALGDEQLARALEAFREAERLLAGVDDAMAHAKLQFNLANSLRQLGKGDPATLDEAERRLLLAREVFSVQAPEYLVQVDDALRSTRGLKTIAQASRTLGEDDRIPASGGDPARGRGSLDESKPGGGGFGEVLAAIREAVRFLPQQARDDPRYPELMAQIEALSATAVTGADRSRLRSDELIALLGQELAQQRSAGKLGAVRGDSLLDLLTWFGERLENCGDGIPQLMSFVHEVHGKLEGQSELLHYLSHGVPRPPAGSRAAELVELCWVLRRFMFAEAKQRNKFSGESRLATDLNLRGSKIDEQIYRAGGDDGQARQIEREVLRPFMVAVRDFAARHFPLLANPIWEGAAVATDPNAVCFAGPSWMRSPVAGVCAGLGLDLMAPPTGQSIAAARWHQLQKAHVAIFDMRMEDGPDRAAVAYQLGIARTLGKPVVVLASAERTLPFDIDVVPLEQADGDIDEAALREALEHALVWLPAKPDKARVAATIDELCARYSRPHPDACVEQTLRVIETLSCEPDPVAFSQAMNALLAFEKDARLMVLHPVWPSDYPARARKRLFHVMPFRPTWADRAATVVEAACTVHGADYVRGDRVPEPNVIHSIWEEINRATHLMVDLTDFNANVALELGIAHTIGRSASIIGQGDCVDRLFPMISRLRVERYDGPDDARLGDFVGNLLRRTG